MCTRRALSNICLAPCLAILALGVGCGSGGSSSPVDAGGVDEEFPPITSSGLEPDEIPLQLDLRCPGDPQCPPSDDQTLYVGAAKRDITPLVEPFDDANGNGFYDAGETYTDVNGNGRFDPVWIAGYGNGRLAFGVHDPTWVRCYALRQGETTLVHCVVDSVGYFQDEAAKIRASLDPSLGVDLLMIGATHVHETQDTIGIWGPDETTTGLDENYMKRIRQAAVEAITEAVHALRPAKMKIGSILVKDPDGNLQPYVSDTRDPVVIDNRMHLMQFDGVDGVPIVTVLNWAAHPESEGSDNHYTSSDYVYWLRESVAQHTGSDVVFVNGSLGGQIGPGQVRPRDEEGQMLPQGERSFRFAEFWGKGLATFANQAFDEAVDVDAPTLAFRHTTFYAHVENILYQTGFRLGLFDRRIYIADPQKPLIRTPDFDNTPEVLTEAAYITLGPAVISTAPGELLPENFVGGYDGSYAGLYPFIDTTQANAPDVTKAPKAPYLRDMMDGEVENRMIFGLSFDFLGYIVPRYNFVLDADIPYLVEAEGDHYEETNSIGSRAEPELVGTMRQLVLSAQRDRAIAAKQAQQAAP